MHRLSASFHLVIIEMMRGILFFSMKANLYELRPCLKWLFYVAHYIYLEPPHIATPCRTSQYFLMKLWQQIYVIICLILDSAHLFALGVTCRPAYVVQVAALL